MAVSYPDDPLGDGFSRALSALWAQMRTREPELCDQRGAWQLWQYSMCESAGHRGRVIASPQAMIIAHQANGGKGAPYPSEEDHQKLLELGGQVAEEETIEI